MGGASLCFSLGFHQCSPTYIVFCLYCVCSVTVLLHFLKDQLIEKKYQRGAWHKNRSYKYRTVPPVYRRYVPVGHKNVTSSELKSYRRNLASIRPFRVIPDFGLKSGTTPVSKANLTGRGLQVPGPTIGL